MKFIYSLILGFSLIIPQHVLAEANIPLITINTRDLDVSLKVDKAVYAMRATRQFTSKSAEKYIKSAKKSAKKSPNILNEDYLKYVYEGTFRAVWASDTLISLHGEHYLEDGCADCVMEYQSHVFNLIAKRPIKLIEIMHGLDRITPESQRIYDHIAKEIATIMLKYHVEEEKQKPITNSKIAEFVKENDYLYPKMGTDNWFKNYAFLTEETKNGFKPVPSRQPVTAIRLFYAIHTITDNWGYYYKVDLPISLFKDMITPSWKKHFKL